MNQSLNRMLLWCCALLLVSGCGQQPPATDAAKDAPAELKQGVTPLPDEQVAVIETASYGNIVLELYPNIAPQMVARFKQLATEGFYNGTTFHRINGDAGLAQGGDPLSKDNNPRNDGAGDSSYPSVPAEFSDLPFDRGTLGAARRGATPEGLSGPGTLTEAQARNTANCQFFITTKRMPELDEEYTVFGKVIGGMQNVDVIAGAPVDEGTERPVDKILIKSITLQPRTRYAR